MDAITYYHAGLSYSVLNVDKKDATLAYYNFEKASQLGHGDAFFFLARAYSMGDGVTQSYEEAVLFAEQGIKYGSIKCKFSWALLMLHLDKAAVLPKDFLLEAYDELFEETKSGDVISCHILGKYFQNGILVEKNLHIAIINFKIAAVGGYSDSQYTLGQIYEEEGATKTALDYYILSAKQGHLFGVYAAGTLSLDIKEYDEAYKYLTLSASQNYPPAFHALGVYYLKQNKPLKASEYIIKGARLGNVNAMYELGIYYFEGIGVDKNIDKSIYWLKLAERTGSVNATYQLGHLYKDQPEIAYKYFVEAGNQNHALASYNVAVMLQNGLGVEKNINKSFFWFQKSAELGFIEAMYHLGFFYYKGLGVKKNEELANKWWNKAALLGHEKSQEIQGATKAYEKSIKSSD